MRKWALVCLLLVLVLVPRAGSAAPIGTNACTLGDIYQCDIFADYATGLSVLNLSPDDPGWLVGYSFLLKLGADVSDGIQDTDVAHALIIHSWGFELFTPSLTSTAFENTVAAALDGNDIDGVSVALGQIVGTPIVSGSSQLDGVGYFFTAPTVTMANQINWGDASFGGTDTLRVHTSLPTPITNPDPDPDPPAPIPEPATLTLLGLGLAGAAYRGRRGARKP
jgi:hypothetical protein